MKDKTPEMKPIKVPTMVLKVVKAELVRIKVKIGRIIATDKIVPKEVTPKIDK